MAKKTIKTVVEVAEKDIKFAEVIARATSNEPVNVEEVIAVAKVLEDQARIYNDTAKILKAGIAGKKLSDIKSDLIARGLITSSEGDLIISISPVTGEKSGIKVEEKEKTTVKVGDSLAKATEETLKMLPKELVRTETKLVKDSDLISLFNADKIPDLYKGEISVTTRNEIVLSKAKI